MTCLMSAQHWSLPARQGSEDHSRKFFQALHRNHATSTAYGPAHRQRGWKLSGGEWTLRLHHPSQQLTQSGIEQLQRACTGTRIVVLSCRRTASSGSVSNAFVLSKRQLARYVRRGRGTARTQLCFSAVATIASTWMAALSMTGYPGRCRPKGKREQARTCSSRRTSWKGRCFERCAGPSKMRQRLGWHSYVGNLSRLEEHCSAECTAGAFASVQASTSARAR
jgi:hypothetical protein